MAKKTKKKKSSESDSPVARRSGAPPNSPADKSKPYFGSGGSWRNYWQDSIDWSHFIGVAESHITRSMKQGTFTEVTREELIAFSKEIPVQRALNRISFGVARMKWLICAPEDADTESSEVKETIRKLTYSLDHCNTELKNDTYLTLCAATNWDELVWGESFLEKAKALASDDNKLFWLWTINYLHIEVNRTWDASRAGIDPLLWYDRFGTRSNWEPFYERDVIPFNTDTTSYNQIPDSPLKLAYTVIREWRKLFKQNSKIVENTALRSILSIENGKVQDIETLQGALDEARAKQGNDGGTVILTGKVSPVNITSRNDAELYPGYTEFLLMLIGLIFNLSRRAMGLTEHDNRATSGDAADSDFQDAILPMALIWQGTINHRLINKVAPGYTFKLVDLEPRSETEEANRAKTLYEAGIQTLNETRTDIGKKPRPGGDRLKTDSPQQEGIPDGDPNSPGAPPAQATQFPPQPEQDPYSDYDSIWN